MKLRAEMIPPADIIYDPSQPRLSMNPEPLVALRENIRIHGMLLPIRVRWDAVLGKWVVIDGHRRLMCALELGLHEVPVIVAEASDPADILAQQVSSNEAREDLSLSELAKAFQRQSELRPNATQAEVGASLALNKSKTSFLQAYFVVDPLVREMVDLGHIPQMGLYYLARTNGETQIGLARALADGSLTVEGCKARVHSLLGKQGRKPKSGKVTLKVAGATFTADSLEGLQKGLDAVRRKLKHAGSLEELAAMLKGVEA